MNQLVTDFFWLRPAWLLAIPVCLVWLWYLSNKRQSAGWQQHISSAGLQHLKIATTNNKYYWYFSIPLIISCMALAGPALVTMPSATASSQSATVIILDLSPSMLAQDVRPDRLTQARYKLIDLLRQHKEGEVALIVYSANAYRVTPLTDDPATIETLVPTMHPEIMPASGSNAEAAVAMAVTMLREAAVPANHILIITDGITAAGISEIEASTPKGIRISILGVGSAKGATIPAESGVLTDDNNLPVIAKLNSPALEQLVKRYQGRFSELTTDSADTHYLASQPVRASLYGGTALTDDTKQFDQYHDLGYWLLPLLLLCAIWGFRKNVIYSVLPIALISPDAQSFELPDLWANSDQQALEHLQQNNYEKAQALFSNPDWKAVAAYRNGQYVEAAQLLSHPVYAEDLYNRGNAQALSGDLEAALKSYGQALLLYSDAEASKRADTVHNITLVKNLLLSEEDDNGQQSDSTRSSGAQSGDNSDTSGSAPTASEGQQSQIGGATGPGQSLDQQSLQQQGTTNSAAQADNNNATDPATDASQRTDQQVAETNETDGQQALMNADRESATPPVIEGSNPVLSPYSEQWLRDLPQDPGGYLRRKFHYANQIREAAQTEHQSSAAASRRY